MEKFLTVKLISGRPAIVDENGTVLLSSIRAGITMVGPKNDDFDHWTDSEWTVIGTPEQGEVRCRDARIEYRREGQGLALRTFFTNLHDESRRSERLNGLWGLWHCGFEKCLYNDFTYANGTLVNEMRSQVVTAKFVDGMTFSGAESMALADADGKQLIAGYITFNHRFPCMDAGSEGRLYFWQQTENHPIAHGETLEGDWIYIGLCDDIRTGLIEYAKIAARYMNSRAGIFDTPYGYCTWYYYGTKLCPETVYENMAVFKENSHRLKAKYFNLDSGWYKEWGDWTENEKFACGMKKIAEDIQAEGYIPGIWLAPFGAMIGSKLHTEHPDWFVKNWNNDKPMQSDCRLCLDMSHPEVKEYITETFRRITCDWGYRHIKIDIITDTIVPGRHYDPNYTSLMNYREGLRLMREAMTEDTVLLACTAPMGPSIGYADGMRTSGDIFHDWKCLRGLFNENLKRYNYNKIWFCNDPDCLLVRTSKNEDEICLRPCIRTDAENRTFATVLMATGGAMILSDKLPLLEEYQLRLLSYMYPINTRAAIPLDLMDSNVPGYLDLGKRNNTHIIALINWTDAVKNMTLNIDGKQVFEFWTQTWLGLKSGSVNFEIEPHGARIVLITDPAPICAVGVDDCLCPEIVQTHENGQLSGSFIKPGEKLFIASKDHIRVLQGGTLSAVPEVPGLYVLTQNGDSLDYRIVPVKG
ncbi:MAG: alpha-galactosidase [Clostridia bacterium]|nr:alpha-galactosidase [Clostridia bacterium]